MEGLIERPAGGAKQPWSFGMRANTNAHVGDLQTAGRPPSSIGATGESARAAA